MVRLHGTPGWHMYALSPRRIGGGMRAKVLLRPREKIHWPSIIRSHSTTECWHTGKHPRMSAYKFVDLFSGCGGLSLGLSMAGLQGVFAVEKDPMAFDTFSGNFLGERDVPVKKFTWPSWLEKKAWGIDDLLDKHQPNLVEMRGTVQVLAGGLLAKDLALRGVGARKIHATSCSRSMYRLSMPYDRRYWCWRTCPA